MRRSYALLAALLFCPFASADDRAAVPWETLGMVSLVKQKDCYVPECGFCMAGGPDQLVEVHAKQGVAYVLDPITVSGKVRPRAR